MSVWFHNFEKDLEENSNKFTRNQMRYLNINLLYKTAKQIDKHSKNCSICKQYKESYKTSLDRLSLIIKKETNQKQYESMLIEATRHLKQAHQIKVSNYFSSLYAFYGGLIGLIITSLYMYISFKTLTHFIVLYGLFIGIFTGLIIGHYKDKKRKSKQKTL